jgi:hypothetical protein
MTISNTDVVLADLASQINEHHEKATCALSEGLRHATRRDGRT